MRTWTEVYEVERESIRRRRAIAFLGRPLPEPARNGNGEPLDDTVGLALSGGGIRSALFNDGFLQALSHRGLLRYIDYISSISGGGYIAGHLVASGVRCRERSGPSESVSRSEENQNDDQEEERSSGTTSASFHQSPECWHLGKHPESGRQDPARLSGIGRYLAKPRQFATAFMASQVFTFATYIGAVGFGATLIALAWRSFDHTGFRDAKSALGLDIGGELLVAFLPVLLVVPLWLVAILLSGVISLAGRSSRFLSVAIRVITLYVFVATLCSIAIFLGNSTTEIASGEAFGNIHLNRTATLLAIAAGVTQILAFLGRDRLFRSEAVEATHLQRLAQRVLSATVVGIAVFAMVHLMGRENISGYTHHRDMQLVRSEIDDWPLLFDIVEDYKPGGGTLVEKAGAARGRYDELEEARHAHIRPKSDWLTWQEEISQSRPTPPAYDEVNTKTISEMWLLPRFGYLYLAVAHEALLGGYPALNRGSSELPRKVAGSPEGIGGKLHYFLAAQADAKRAQVELLKRFNEALEMEAFTNYLFEQSGILEQPGTRQVAVDDWIDEMSEDRAGWDTHRKTALAEKILWYGNARAPREGFQPRVQPDDPDGGEATGEPHWRKRRFVALNRELLDLAYPDLLRARTIASTAVVVAHDQAARRRWLLIWTAMLLVGLVGTVRLNRQSPLYQYYRNVLSRRFLRGWPNDDVPSEGEASGTADANKCPGELQLTDADVTDVGLPYPLFLTTLFRRAKVEGTAKLRQSPFLFTPKYVGVSSSVTDRCCVETHAYGIPQRAPWPGEVTLADAIAISGSAITPSMTENRALALIMDFFGLRLGQWVPNPATPRKPFWGYATVAYESLGFNRGCGDWSYAFVADGGFFDYLGVYELLHRRCRLILVTDAGSNIKNEEHGPLAEMLERASTDLGVTFLDLDHEAPIDFGRLTRDEKRLVPQPYLCMRIRYHDESGERESEGIMIYVQMSITESDPIEIRQIRHRFPSFPDEPTENQFYTDDQVAAFRRLGYHIGSRVCRDLERWSPVQIGAAESRMASESTGIGDLPFYGCGSASDGETEALCGSLQRGRQPLFDVVLQRLLSSYRSNCFEEVSYRRDDIFAEAIWDPGEWCFPTVAQRAGRVFADSQDAADRWLTEYELSGDVRAAYRHAVFLDVNHEILPARRRWTSAHRELIDGLIGGAVDGRSALIAHFVVTAIACHQLHRGTPRSALQIGGRQKLIDIMRRVVSDLAFEGEVKISLREWLRNSCAELVELRRRVFHGAEAQTVVSVMQTFLMQGFCLQQLLTMPSNVPDLAYFPSIRFRREAFRFIKGDDVERLRRLIDETFDEMAKAESGSDSHARRAAGEGAGHEAEQIRRQLQVLRDQLLIQPKPLKASWIRDMNPVLDEIDSRIQSLDEDDPERERLEDEFIELSHRVRMGEFPDSSAQLVAKMEEAIERWRVEYWLTPRNQDGTLPPKKQQQWQAKVDRMRAEIEKAKEEGRISHEFAQRLDDAASSVFAPV